MELENNLKLEKFNPEVLREYDIRGIVDLDLTLNTAYTIGRTFGYVVCSQFNEKTIVVGYDGRLTSPKLHQSLCKGLEQSGANVISIGMGPTPMTYFAHHKMQTNAAIMVTGSHNPSEYNGFKMVLNQHSFFAENIQFLQTLVDDPNLSTKEGSFREVFLKDVYVKRNLQNINLDKKLKIAWDVGNGAMGAVMDLFTSQLSNAEHIVINKEVDGTFPNHHPDPSQPKNLRDLQHLLETQTLDLGIAFDGDGDRLGIIAPGGEIIWPDRQLLLFAKDILTSQPGCEIIYDVKCSRLLSTIIQEAGGRPTMWKTGHSFIKAKLKETGAALAGEMSGHIFFQDRWYGFDDAIYAGARFCELVSRWHDSAENIFQSIPNTVNTPELRLEMKEGENYQLMKEFTASARFPNAEVTYLDGVRVDYPDGFGLIRASNTTPTVIFRFEADTETALIRIKEEFRMQLDRLRANVRLPY